MNTRLPRCQRCVDHPGWAHGDESRRREPEDVCPACFGSGVRQQKSSRPNHNAVLARLRDDFGDGDPWGTVISWAFGVAEVLYARGDEVPSELGYNPSPFVAIDTEASEEYPDSEVWQMLYEGDTTVEDLQFAGRCLARYLDWLRAAGLDY